MMFLNYEIAQSVMDSSDLVVVRTAVVIHRAMLNRSRLPVPIAPVDMRYLYDSLINTVASYVGHAVNTPIVLHDGILAANIPALTSSPWLQYDFVRSGLADAYLQRVTNDSQRTASPFDVGFGVAVACQSFDSRSLEWIALAKDISFESKEDDFDRWLEGFGGHGTK
jgi:hypothetical protein